MCCTPPSTNEVLIQRHDTHALDASALLAPLLGLLRRDHERVRKTVPVSRRGSRVPHSAGSCVCEAHARRLAGRSRDRAPFWAGMIRPLIDKRARTEMRMFRTRPNRSACSAWVVRRKHSFNVQADVPDRILRTRPLLLYVRGAQYWRSTRHLIGR
jgi:hypothetical protein